MMESGNGSGNMYMPVAPAYGGGGGFGNGFGGDALWLLLFFCIMGGWGNNGYGANAGGGGLYPWMNQSNQINDGFRDQMINSNITGIQNAVTSGFGDVQLGIAGLGRQICETGNGITGAVRDGFFQSEIAANARQMADMNQTFGFQTSMLQGFNGLQGQLAQCCCDNRLATCQTQNLVQSEGAATRLAIQNQTQQILDKMCQQEIDALKRENENLRTMVNMQNLAASQTAQTAQLIADNTAQTQYIVNRVAPYPVPAYTVPNPFTPAATTNG